MRERKLSFFGKSASAWALATLGLISSEVGHASSRGAPSHFSDFVLFSKESILGQRSDFQGPIGSLGAIRLEDFGLRTEPENRSIIQDPIQSAVYTNGSFDLIRGEIALGGVTAGGDLNLKNCRIDGLAQSKGSVRGSRSCPAGKGFKSRISSLTPSPEVFQRQMDEISTKIETASRARSPKINWSSYTQLPQQLVLDAKGDPTQVFVIRVAGNSRQVIRDATVFLKNGARAENILYFFPTADEILLTRTGSRNEQGADLGLPGTLLAPSAKLFAFDTRILGAAYVRDFDGTCTEDPTVQINAAPFRSWDRFEKACSTCPDWIREE